MDALIRHSSTDVARITHLNSVLIKGPEPNFPPLDPNEKIKFTPMAVFTRFHSPIFTQYQIDLALKLSLALSLPQPESVCLTIPLFLLMALIRIALGSGLVDWLVKYCYTQSCC